MGQGTRGISPWALGGVSLAVVLLAGFAVQRLVARSPQPAAPVTDPQAKKTPVQVRGRDGIATRPSAAPGTFGRRMLNRGVVAPCSSRAGRVATASYR